MATPVAFTTFVDGAPTTSRAVTLPSAAARTGKRLFVFGVLSTGTITSATGWTQLGATGSVNNRRLYCYYRDCVGTTADNLTVVSTSAYFQCAIVVITGAKSTTPTLAGVQGGTTGNPDPPALTSPSWAPKPTLYFAVATITDIATAGTAPSGYTLDVSIAGLLLPLAGLSVAHKDGAGAAENPGTFGQAGTTYTAQTIAQEVVTTIAAPAPPTNAQTFYAPTVKKSFTKPQTARHDNAQSFFAPTVTVAITAISVQPARHDNAQTFYAPKVTAKLAAPLHTNAQSFFGPKLAARYAVGAPHTNAQTLFAPKVGTRLTESARHDNAQTFFAPKVSARLTQSARHDNAQTIFAPRLGLGVKATARVDNAQTYFAPRVTVRFAIAARHDNAQALFAPTVTRIAAPFLAPLHTNAQTFFAPKLTQRRTVGARFDNAQAFYAPVVKFTATVRPTLHTNAQSFFAPRVRASFTPPLHTNGQAFYAPTVLRVGAPIQVPPPFANPQSFFGPALAATYQPGARFDNAQAFFGPTVKQSTAVQPTRFDNAQAFYAPARTQALKPPRHTNAQAFFAPARAVGLTAPLHTNQQTFHAQARTEARALAARHDNAQAFYAPSVTRVAPPLTVTTRHTNAQSFFGPKLAITVKQTGGGAPGWNVTGPWTFDHEVSGGHYFHTMTLAQDAAGNLSGSGFVSIYLYNVTSGTVVGNAIEFFATYYDPALVIGVVLHVIGTIAPDGTISGNWTDTYGGGRAGTLTTAPGGGAAVSVPGGAGFTNAQAFFGPRVARHEYVAPARHDNAQAFFGPRLSVRYAVGARVDNVQAFFGPKLAERLTATARHTNVQTFFAPTVTRGKLLPPLFVNAQAFYAPKLTVRLGLVARHTNAQAFFAPLKVNIPGAAIKTPLHVNAQSFFGPSVSFTEPVTPEPGDGVRVFDMFANARAVFNGNARLMVFTGERRNEFMPARVTEFGGERRTVFRSRLVTEGELVL